jgi:AraC family transcriptional regulator
MTSLQKGAGASPAGFYGSTVRSRAESHFGISERLYPPYLHTPVHVHSKALLCVVLGGAYYETHCGKTRYCTPATMVFHAPNQNHRERFEDSGGRSLVVEIDAAWMNRTQECAKVAIDATTVLDEGPVSLVGARLYKEFLNPDQASGLVIEGLMLEAVGEIARIRTARDRRPPRWLEQSRELIQEHFLRCLSLSEIAEAVDIHPVHLAQSFRKFYNCTVGDYVRSLRIDFACRQLRQPEIPLSEIALHAGFADQSHFSRTFKKTVGVPPSQYRREIEQSADPEAD